MLIGGGDWHALLSWHGLQSQGGPVAHLGLQVVASIKACDQDDGVQGQLLGELLQPLCPCPIIGHAGALITHVGDLSAQKGLSDHAHVHSGMLLLVLGADSVWDWSAARITPHLAH